MKALTIQQPWAHLIGLPDSDPQAKRIENRRWATRYRGLILIHAGKSLASLSEHPAGEKAGLLFSAALAVAQLVECVPFDRLPEALRDHPYAAGPYCWLLADVQKLAEPVYCMGAQGLWEPEPWIVEKVNEQLRRAA